jgi:hypothetical protein
MMFNDPELQEAWHRGTVAAQCGRKWGECPYPPDSMREVAWRNAFNQAQRQITPAPFAPGAVEHFARRVTWRERLVDWLLWSLAAAGVSVLLGFGLGYWNPELVAMLGRLV